MGVGMAKKYMLNALGAGWTIKHIDLEQCVYCDLGRYDIEVSNCKNIRSKINVYVWDKSDYPHTVEKHFDLTIDKAIEVCRDIMFRYSGR